MFPKWYGRRGADEQRIDFGMVLAFNQLLERGWLTGFCFSFSPFLFLDWNDVDLSVPALDSVIGDNEHRKHWDG